MGSAAPADILAFWFGRTGEPGFGQARSEWFRKDVAFDDQIRSRFLQLAGTALDQAWDKGLSAVEKLFIYLPLEHSEALADQERSVALFSALAAEHPGCDGFLDYARRHHEVIARFGRFPHRNAALGRPSTPEETSYLAQPGSGF
mgnify:CR=1 FL=1